MQSESRDWLEEAFAIADTDTMLLAQREHVVVLVALLRATRGDVQNAADRMNDVACDAQDAAERLAQDAADLAIRARAPRKETDRVQP